MSLADLERFAARGECRAWRRIDPVELARFAAVYGQEVGDFVKEASRYMGDAAPGK